MPEKPTPYILAMILCDHIHVDPATGKHYLLGLFSTIGAKDFPVKHSGMALHLELTDGRGDTRIEICLVDAEGEREPIFKTEGQVAFPDPRMIAQLDFGMHNIVFPEPGEYRFQIYANDELLMERRLVVARIGEQERGQ